MDNNKNTDMVIGFPADLDNKISIMAKERNETFDECVEYLMRYSLRMLENGTLTLPIADTEET